jgi:nitrogen fixation/metabolism regulation signal transduction histidine kinase
MKIIKWLLRGISYIALPLGVMVLAMPLVQVIYNVPGHSSYPLGQDEMIIFIILILLPVLAIYFLRFEKYADDTKKSRVISLKIILALVIVGFIPVIFVMCAWLFMIFFMGSG